MTLKQPLVAILIAPDRYMRDRIHRGVKTITIREGHRDYKIGQNVMLCCHIEPWAVMADITSVKHCTLDEVTKEEHTADGFSDKQDMLNGMRRFYPGLELHSPVTVIRWEKARGRWVDDSAFYTRAWPLGGD